MISLRLVEEEGIEHVVEELRVILVQLEGQKLLNQITSCESDYLKIRKKTYEDPKYCMCKKACEFLNNISMLCRIIFQASFQGFFYP